MAPVMESSEKKQAAAAVGRTFGALFFSTFGGLWLVLASYAFGHLTVGIGLAIAAGWAGLVVAAVQLQRRGRDAAAGAYTQEEERRNGRAFGIVNAVQWIAIFATFQITVRLHHPDLAYPIVVLIVGLHFFVMPPLYRHRDNLITATGLVLWAILCLAAFRGDRLVAMSALGTGVVLWLSASRNLIVARNKLAGVMPDLNRSAGRY